MITVIAATSLVLGQQTKISYDVAIGSSFSFHERVLAVKEALSAKDFKTAATLGKQLPSGTITYSISTKNLNADNSDDMMNAVDSAVALWNKMLKDHVKISEAKPGTAATVKFSFQPTLAKRAGAEVVAGAATFEATSPVPTVEEIIGLKRGTNLQPSTPLDVFNEALFAFGTYFGLAAEPSLGTAMGRSDMRMTAKSQIIPIYIESVRNNLNLSKNLRKAAIDKIVVHPAQSKVAVDAKEIIFPKTLQGDMGQAKALVSNIGNAPLLARAAGDCTCIGGSIEQSIPASGSTLLQGRYNTVELSGMVQHNIVLRTNDPNRPMMIIPAKIEVKPRIEVIYPNTNTYYVDPENPIFTMFIHSNDGTPAVQASEVIGVDGTVTVEPFIGDVPDFMHNTPNREVNGYRVDVNLSKLNVANVFGRMMGAAVIRVDHPVLKTIRANFYVQKGIVAQPEQVYLGKPTGPANASVIIAAAGKSFKITKVTSDSKNLSFTVTPRSIKGEYTIAIAYDGKATLHNIAAQITVETDDPKQPKIIVPISTR